MMWRLNLVICQFIRHSCNCGVIGVDRESKLVLKGRFSIGVNKFQLLVVRNDQIVACMLAVPSKYGMSSVELFIEHAPSHPYLNNEIDQFIELPTDGINANEGNDEDRENDKHDVINSNEVVLPNDDENYGQRETLDLMMVQQVVESESLRYVNLEGGDRSNNPNVEVENTLSIISPHDTQVNISNHNGANNCTCFISYATYTTIFEYG